jgi:hypothetical protein
VNQFFQPFHGSFQALRVAKYGRENVAQVRTEEERQPAVCDLFAGGPIYGAQEAAALSGVVSAGVVVTCGAPQIQRPHPSWAKSNPLKFRIAAIQRLDRCSCSEIPQKL